METIRFELSNTQKETLKTELRQILNEEVEKFKDYHGIRYMKKFEVCSYLGVSNNKLDQMIKNEDFPLIKIQGVLRFDKLQVDQWMTERSNIS